MPFIKYVKELLNGGSREAGHKAGSIGGRRETKKRKQWQEVECVTMEITEKIKNERKKKLTFPSLFLNFKAASKRTLSNLKKPIHLINVKETVTIWFFQ